MFLATDDLLINHSSQTEIDVRGGGGRGLAFRTTDFALVLFILNMFMVIQASISCTQSSFANFPRSTEEAGKKESQRYGVS